MKKYLITTLLLCVVVLACGCRNKDKKPDINKTPDYKNILQTSSEIDFGDITYNFETDSQNYFDFDGAEVVLAPEGYYTFLSKEDSTYLAYMDREGSTDKKYLPVCSRPDCMHDSKDCDANLKDVWFSYIKYYEGDLYTILTWSDDTKMVFYFYKISIDGSIRSKLFEIYSVPKVDGCAIAATPQFNIHRGYVYYTFDSEDYSYLYRSRLDGTEKKNICKKDSSDGSIGEICGYGDGVMVTMYHGYSDNEVCYFSNKTDALYQIKTGVNATYCLDGYDMICTDGSCMKKINLKDMNEQVIAEGIDGVVKSSYDGNYIYIDDFSEKNRKVYIYDINGNYVDEISIDKSALGAMCYGDDKWFFMNNEMVIDKSQIGTGRYDIIDIDISAFDALKKE